RHRDPQRFRQQMGKVARRAETVDEATRRAVIAGRLPSHEWPERDLKVTAVDVETGEFVVFDRHSGVGLVDAVAASCAVPAAWPPVTINGRRFMDGGLRSPSNVDLAAEAARVVVLAPIADGGGPLPKASSQLAALTGAKV